MEQKFGCAFNPRPAPGRCIKDATYKKIDPQCESTETTCRLFNSPLPSPAPSPSAPTTTLPAFIPLTTTILPPAPVVAQTTHVVKKTDKGKDKISGPISAYVTEYNGKKYEFFGDAHYSMTGTCDKPCNDVDITAPNFRGSLNEMINSNVPCWDIAVLLSNMFNDAAAKGKWIDFYIEIPFIKLIAPEFHVRSNVEQAGYLYKLYYVFYNCFAKIKCNYSTTRFHYVDVRQQYKSVDLASLTDELKHLLEAMSEPQYNVGTFASYEMYIVFERIQKSIRRLSEIILKSRMEGNKIERSAYIEETDKLVRDLYFSGGQTMTGKIEPKNVRLLKLYLLSDNFDRDVKNLMNESILVSTEPIKLLESLIPVSLIVNRRGKNMHRIRAQLEALENEGQGDLTNRIVPFILETYNREVNVNKIIDLWRSITLTYEGLLDSKFKKFDDVSTLMNKFAIEYKKASKFMSMSVSGASLLMDAYTLARMFRSYPNENKRTHINSSKNIVYAGDAHIQTYVNFFETVLGTSFIKYEPNKEFLKRFHSDDPNINPKDIIRCLNVNLSDFY